MTGPAFPHAAATINRPRRLLPILLLAGTAAAAAPAWAQTPAPNGQDKRVDLVEVRADPLALTVEPTQDGFRVDEPIRFEISGNRTFFLYVYSVDPDTGDARLLVPSRDHKNNKYAGGRDFRVPERGLEFVADKPRTERFVFVASTRHLDLGEPRRVDPGAAPAKDGDGLLVAKEAALEDLFAAQGVRLRDVRSGKPDAEVAVREVEVRITAASPRADAAAAPAAVPFVNTDQASYRVGERIRIAYGADRAGWVTLFAVNPDGTVSRLRDDQVAGDRVYTLNARAEDPSGPHALAAVFSAAGPAAESALAGLPGGRAAGDGGKAIVPEGEPRAPVALREIRIEP